MTANVSTDRDLYVSEAAAQLRKSELTIRRWIAAGRLPARMVGSRVLVRESDVQRVLVGVPVVPAAKN